MAEFDPETNITECYICHDLYTEPKILPCAHLLCRDCLVSWITTNKQALCPICREVIFVEQDCKFASFEEIADNLPNDLAMVELIKCKKLLSKSHVCCAHVSVAASSLCLQCGDMMCPSCSDVHARFTATRHHTVLKLSILTPEVMVSSKYTPCSLHSDEPSKLYCIVHGVPFCRSCSSSNHRSCPEVIPLEKMIEFFKKKLSDMEEKLKRTELSFDQKIKELEELLKVSDENTATAYREMDDAFNRLQISIEKCRIRLKERVKDEDVKVKAKLNRQSSVLRTQREIITSHLLLIKHVRETSVPCSSMNDIISLLNTRMSHINLDTSLSTNNESPYVNTFAVDEDKIVFIEQYMTNNSMIKEFRDSKANHAAEKSFQQQKEFVDFKTVSLDIHTTDVSSITTSVVGKDSIGEKIEGHKLVKENIISFDKKISSSHLPSEREEENYHHQQQKEDLVHQDKEVEEFTRTVQVHGLTSEDELLCRLYFENKRRSGGGAIENGGLTWDPESECFILTFEDIAVARTVVTRKHTLNGKDIHVEVWKAPLYYNDAILLSGLPLGTTEDLIQDFLESIADVSVASVQLDKPNGKALIVFEQSFIDVAMLNKFCRENKFNDSMTLSVNSIPVSHTILVQNINPGISTEFIRFFFMNKIKNKGGPIKNVQRLNETTALVFFQNPKDAEAVVDKRSHVLDGNTLQVSLYITDFTSVSESHANETTPATEESPNTSLTTFLLPDTTINSTYRIVPFRDQGKTIKPRVISRHTLKTLGFESIQDDAQTIKELDANLEAVNCRYKWIKKPDGILVTCAQTDPPQNWKMEAEKVPDRFLLNKSVKLGEEMVSVKQWQQPTDRSPHIPQVSQPAHWNNAPQQFYESHFQESITGKCDKCDGDLSDKENSERKNTTTNALWTSDSNLAEKSSDISTTVLHSESIIPLKKHQIKFLSRLQAWTKFKAQHPHVVMSINETAGILKFKAPENIQTIAKSDILRFIIRISEKRISLSPAQIAMYRQKGSQEYVNKMLDENEIICHWEVSDSHILLSAVEDDYDRIINFFSTFFHDSLLST